MKAKLLKIIIQSIVVLGIITYTGGLTSPLFFLCYFLLFTVALLYHIEGTLSLTAIMIFFFSFLPSTDFGSLAHLTQFLSLIMVTPLAIFTGHEYETMIEQKRLNMELKKHLIGEETDTLLFLSLNLRRTLVSALDSLSTVIPQEKVKSVRTNLETLYTDLRALYRTSLDLEKSLT